MNLLRNDKVRYEGRPMIVVAANQDGPEVELAERGWDGVTPGVRVHTSEVVPLEQMLPAEEFDFVAALTERQVIEALHFMAARAPHALVEYGQSFRPGLLPERLRPAEQDAGAVLAAFEDVDGGDRRG